MARAKFRKLEVDSLPRKDQPSKNGKNMFKVQTARDRLLDASKMQMPKMLCSELIFETDLTILFASAGVGKTFLAYQIANSIASGIPIDGFEMQSGKQPVLYVDFELSKLQFERRYCEVDTKNKSYNHFLPHENLKMVTFDKEYEETITVSGIIEHLKFNLDLSDSKIIFIDNITWINQTSLEKSKDASLLMKELIKLKRENNLTIVVLAHTPKKNMWSPMTLNDLAGSSQIGNFCDSVFTINYSKHQNDFRYIKQVKCRFSELRYHAKNVIPVQLTKIQPNFTGYKILPEDDENIQEDYHLESKIETKIVSAEIREELLEKTKELVNANPDISARELASELGVGKDTALKYKAQVSGVDRQTNN